jgi:hypothetical protein
MMRLYYKYLWLAKHSKKTYICPRTQSPAATPATQNQLRPRFMHAYQHRYHYYCYHSSQLIVTLRGLFWEYSLTSCRYDIMTADNREICIFLFPIWLLEIRFLYLILKMRATERWTSSEPHHSTKSHKHILLYYTKFDFMKLCMSGTHGQVRPSHGEQCTRRCRVQQIGAEHRHL